jgi:hypothetical protein
MNEPMAKFDDFYAALDTDPGVRGKQFERFVKCSQRYGSSAFA